MVVVIFIYIYKKKMRAPPPPMAPPTTLSLYRLFHTIYLHKPIFYLLYFQA